MHGDDTPAPDTTAPDTPAEATEPEATEPEATEPDPHAPGRPQDPDDPGTGLGTTSSVREDAESWGRAWQEAGGAEGHADRVEGGPTTRPVAEP